MPDTRLPLRPACLQSVCIKIALNALSCIPCRQHAGLALQRVFHRRLQTSNILLHGSVFEAKVSEWVSVRFDVDPQSANLEVNH